MTEKYSPVDATFYTDAFMFGHDEETRSRYERRRNQAKAELRQLFDSLSREANFQKLLAQDKIKILHVAAGGGAVTEALQAVLAAKGIAEKASIVCLDIDPNSLQSHKEAGIAVDGFEVQDAEDFLNRCLAEGKQFDIIVGLLVTGKIATDVANFVTKSPAITLDSGEIVHPYALFTTSSPKKTQVYNDPWIIQDWVNHHQAAWVSSQITYYGKFGLDMTHIVGTDPQTRLKKDTPMDWEEFKSQ